MMPSTVALTAYTALIASLVALVVGLWTAFVNRRNAGLQAVIVQQTKHAEFRQAWINRLREQMAELSAAAYGSAANGDEEVKRQLNIRKAAAMVRLLMDRNDTDY